MSLSKQLCLRICPYYKPSKDEALACRGFVEVQMLLKKGREICLDGRSQPVRPETAKELVSKMCPVCEFYREDCDFIVNMMNASPCGGFSLIGQLIEDGTITVDDIGEIE